MSDERLPCSAEEWANRILNCFGPEIVIIGLGSKGALLAIRSQGIMERLPAITVRPVVNTIGAGDALFSAFLHCYINGEQPYLALQKAMVFAGYKIGVSGAADGFLDDASLAAWFSRVSAQFQGAET